MHNATNQSLINLNMHNATNRSLINLNMHNATNRSLINLNMHDATNRSLINLNMHDATNRSLINLNMHDATNRSLIPSGEEKSNSTQQNGLKRTTDDDSDVEVVECKRSKVATEDNDDNSEDSTRNDFFDSETDKIIELISKTFPNKGSKSELKKKWVWLLAF